MELIIAILSLCIASTMVFVNLLLAVAISPFWDWASSKKRCMRCNIKHAASTTTFALFVVENGLIHKSLVEEQWVPSITTLFKVWSVQSWTSCSKYPQFSPNWPWPGIKTSPFELPRRWKDTSIIASRSSLLKLDNGSRS